MGAKTGATFLHDQISLPYRWFDLNHEQIYDATKRKRIRYIYGEESPFRKRRVRQQQ